MQFAISERIKENSLPSALVGFLLSGIIGSQMHQNKMPEKIRRSVTIYTVTVACKKNEVPNEEIG